MNEINLKCPLCNSGKHTDFYFNVKDYVADLPGDWNFVRCSDCNSIFLSIRVCEADIEGYYATYYTHNAHPVGLFQKAWQSIIDNYVEYVSLQFRQQPALLMSIVYKVFESKIKSNLRNITKLPVLESLKVLDVGYGDGLFLSRAKMLGCECYGIEPDEKCIRFSELNNFKHIGESITELNNYHEYFDYITISHVLEHSYAPREMLQRCFSSLKKGGYLWVESPNADSQLLKIFGKYWRGLESPRHIFLPNWAGLESVLREIGFSEIQRKPKWLNVLSLAVSSFDISKKYNTKHGVGHLFKVPWGVLCGLLQVFNKYKRTEFVTIIARKI